MHRIASEHIHRLVNRARCWVDLGCCTNITGSIGAHASVCKPGEMSRRCIVLGFGTNITESEHMHRIASEHMHRFVNRARLLADASILVFVQTSPHHRIRAHAPDRIVQYASVCKPGGMSRRCIDLGSCTNITASLHMHRIASDNIMLPKRRFWKTEQKIGRVFSRHFARV